MPRSPQKKRPARSPEYAKRLDRLARKLRRLGVDVFFVETPVNRYYLTGFASSNGLLALTPEGEADFLTDFRYLEEARRAIPEARVAALPQRGASLEPLARRRGWRRIGYEGAIPAQRLEALRTQLPEIGFWRDCERALSALRSVKSRTEQTLLRRAAHLGDEVFARAVADTEPGMTELELRRLLRYWADRLGAEGMSFDCIVSTGAHSSKVHTVAGPAPLRRGRPLLIDMGVVSEHYCSDMTRALCIGRQSDKMHEIYQVVRTAQQKALDAVRAGRACSEVDAAARDYIERRGYGRRFGHGTGHGVGLEIHEAPSLWQGSKEILRTGMVVTVEPGIYLPGVGGVRIEDTVIVRPQGCEILNRTPKELIVIEG